MRLIKVEAFAAFSDVQEQTTEGIEDVISRALNDGLDAECVSIRTETREIPLADPGWGLDELAECEAWQQRAFDEIDAWRGDHAPTVQAKASGW